VNVIPPAEVGFVNVVNVAFSYVNESMDCDTKGNLGIVAAVLPHVSRTMTASASDK
jgi:hypothetical protein